MSRNIFQLRVIFSSFHTVSQRKTELKYIYVVRMGTYCEFLNPFRDENDKKFPFEYEMGVVSPNITRLGNLSKNCVEQHSEEIYEFFYP